MGAKWLVFRSCPVITDVIRLHATFLTPMNTKHMIEIFEKSSRNCFQYGLRTLLAILLLSGPSIYVILQLHKSFAENQVEFSITGLSEVGRDNTNFKLETLYPSWEAFKESEELNSLTL